MKVGRNDECPCKSGKKFKKCHMSRFVYPKDYFLAKTFGGNLAPEYHMERAEGNDEWVSKPGRMYFRMYYGEEEYEDVDLLIKKMKGIIPANSQLMEKICTERIKRLKHKLYGIKYHFANFINEEDKEISQRFSKYHGTDHEMVRINPRLLYEIESFLFQVGSTLDIIAQIISITYKFKKIAGNSDDDSKKINTFTDSGTRLIKLLENNVNEPSKLKSLKLAEIIKRHRDWIVDTVDMRTDVTHYSDLEGFSCFIQEAWEGGPTTKIWFPSMPDGQRARNYIQNTWNQLLGLIEDILPYLKA